VGARNVVITDINPWRLELALRMGATRTVNVSKESLKDVQHELGMVGGFDIGLEMSGNPQAFEQMIDNMYNGGRIALLGLLPDDAGIEWSRVIFKGLFLKGIYGREIFETWYKMQAMLLSGLVISPVITHRFGFEDFEKRISGHAVGRIGQSCPEFQLTMPKNTHEDRGRSFKPGKARGEGPGKRPALPASPKPGRPKPQPSEFGRTKPKDRSRNVQTRALHAAVIPIQPHRAPALRRPRRKALPAGKLFDSAGLPSRPGYPSWNSRRDSPPLPEP
jgi:hypothetical protein